MSLEPRPTPEPEPEAEKLAEKIEHAVERVGEAVGRVEERVEHAAGGVADEVAEHVPPTLRRPVRWTVQKLIVVSVLGTIFVVLAIVAGVAYYVWNHTEWASHEVTWRVNQALREHSDVELSVGGLRGNPLSRVTVLQPRVRFRDGEGPALLEARSMTLRYSTWDLFTAKRGALVIEVDRPVVRLARGPDGKLRVPEWHPGKAPIGVRRGFDYVIRIHAGDVVVPDPQQSVEDFDLEAAVSTGGPTAVDVRSLRWKRGLYGLSLQSLRGAVTAGDSVVVRVDELKSPELALRAHARWKRDEGPKLLEADVARLRWRWLALATRNRTFDVPGEAAFSVRAREEGGWTGDVNGRATWNDAPVAAKASFIYREGHLTLDPLSGVSPAGELSQGRLHWSKQGWDLTASATEADPARWDVLGIRGWPAGDLQGRFRYAVDSRRANAAQLEAWLNASEWSGWRVDSAVVRVDFPPSRPDSFRVHAVRRGGRVDLAGRVQGGGWTGTYAVQDLPLDEWPDGRASGLTGTLGRAEGTVEGRKGALWVKGRLEGGPARWFGLDASRWRLDEVEGRLIPTPDLRARARLENAFYLGVRFDSLASPLHLGDRELEMPSFQAHAADTVVTMAARAEWDAHSWRLVGDQASMRSRHFAWVADEPVRLSGDPKGVLFERLLAHDQDARLEIGGRWALPGGGYDWRARAQGLHLDRLGLPDDLALKGVADAELTVTGPSGQPRWHFDAAVASPSAHGRELDSLVVALEGGPSWLEIGGRWALPGGGYDWRARAQGLHLDRLGLPDDLALKGVADAELTVTGPSGQPRWHFGAAVASPSAHGRELDSLVVALEGGPSWLEVPELKARVGEGWVEASGQFQDMARAWPDSLTPQGVERWLANASRWTGRVRARAMPFERTSRLLGAPGGVSGIMGGSLDLSGRPARPEFVATLEAAPLVWRGVRVDAVTANARYRDDRLEVSSLKTTRDAAVSQISGSMDVELALGKKPEILNAPMRWTVDLPNGDLALVPLLVPQIGAASGRLVIQGQVTGTPRRPELAGNARIEQGRLRLAGREEVLENVSAALRFETSRVVLESLTATQKSQQEPGKVTAKGAVDFPQGRPPSYRFDLSMRDFTALETGVYAARFDGDFVVTDGVRMGRQILPHVTSKNVEIQRAIVLYDFTRQTEAQQVEASTQPLFWTYQLRVHANDNLMWQPPDGDIEFSADLNLDQSADKLVIFGDMEALRGTYYFLSNRFTIRKATLTFDEVRGVDPLVDAEATTRLIPTYAPATLSSGLAPSGDARSHTITVRIQGRSSAPTVEFASDPPDLDEAQILRELTIGRFDPNAPNFALGFSDPFQSYLTRVISRQLSQELSRAFRGYVSEWEIARESGVSGTGGLVLGVGSQLNSRLALRYRQLLPGTARAAPVGVTTNLFERDLEAEYRINRFFYITSQLTQKRSVTGTTSVSAAPDFNVNLKARWEY